MDKCLKILRYGAFALFAGAVGLCAFMLYLPAMAFLAAGGCLWSAAALVRREWHKADSERAESEARARQAVSRAALEQEQTRARCKQDIAHFHSMISHGLRIPVSIILGYSELLKRGMVQDEQVRDEYLQKICEKVIYINELLGQMLLEMRTETGMTGLIKKPVEILSFLDRIASDVGAAAAKRGVSVRVVSEDDEIYIMGNETGLTKAFYNILENSLKYMGGAGNINITVSRINEDETLLVFKDDGQGLSAEETAHIFELNYQGSNRAEGNGLGLYLVKNEIEAHGGTVTAKSGVGRGMGIYVTLPAARCAEPVSV